MKLAQACSNRVLLCMLSIMPKPNDPSSTLVSLTLKTLITDLLREEHYVPISDETAEVIMFHCKNKHTCYIQFPSDVDVDILGRAIETPILWEIGAWSRASEKWMKARNRSERDRADRFIMEANVNMVARKILKFAYVNPDAARVIAHSWVKGNVKGAKGKLKMVGVEKLYTTVEELPQ